MSNDSCGMLIINNELNLINNLISFRNKSLSKINSSGKRSAFKVFLESFEAHLLMSSTSCFEFLPFVTFWVWKFVIFRGTFTALNGSQHQIPDTHLGLRSFSRLCWCWETLLFRMNERASIYNFMNFVMEMNFAMEVEFYGQNVFNFKFVLDFYCNLAILWSFSSCSKSSRKTKKLYKCFFEAFVNLAFIFPEILYKLLQK